VCELEGDGSVEIGPKYMNAATEDAANVKKNGMVCVMLKIPDDGM
jgi:hypothetical protein